MFHSVSKKSIFILLVLSALSLVWLTSHLWKIFPLVAQFGQYDPDSILFGRLLEQSILRGHIIETDSYSCFPYEIRHGFAPFYLWFLYNATVSWFEIFPESQIDPMHVAGLLPIVFTWIIGLLITLVSLRISKDNRFMLFCCFFMLPSCGSAYLSGFMHLDYDFLISFLIWGWIICYLMFLETGKSFWKLAGAVGVGLFVATWSGTPLFFFFATLYGIFVWLRDSSDTDTYLDYAASSMLIGAGVNLILLRAAVLGSELFVLSKYSYFQPTCILLGGIACHILREFRRRRISRTYGAVGIILLALLIGVVFRVQLLQSTGFLFKSDPIHKSITELRAVFEPLKFIENNANLKGVMSLFGFSIAFLPFFLFLPWKCFDTSTERFLRFWLCVMLFLTFYQIRYIRWIGIGVGLYFAVVFTILWRMARSEISPGKFRHFWLVAAFLPMLVSQSYHNFYWGLDLAMISEPQVEAYSWIKRNTPETSGYSSEAKPEYGILTHWDEGNHLAYYSRRPSVVNNAMWGFKTMADIFSSKNEQSSVELFDKYNIRYVLLSTYRQYGEDHYKYWTAFKDMPEKPEYILSHSNSELVLDNDYTKSFYFWLLENLALTSRAGFKESSHFRMVYASKTPAEVLPPYILFEKVAGAKLKICADPEMDASISIELKVGQVNYLFKKREACNKNGEAFFNLPYTSAHRGGRIATDPFYKVSFYQKGKLIKARLLVSEDAVQSGFDVSPGLTVLDTDNSETPSIPESSEN